MTRNGSPAAQAVQRQAAKVLGVDQKTISNDLRKNSSQSEENVRTGSAATKQQKL
jgi:hypothetical protein